jgi:polysaccharide deacetylase 2 family uncharacterized protein YibQ
MIMLGSLTAAAVSLIVIGHQLVSAWLSTEDSQLTQILAMPASNQKTILAPKQKKQPPKVNKLEPKPEPMSKSVASVIKTAEAAVVVPKEKAKPNLKPTKKVVEKFVEKTAASEKPSQKVKAKIQSSAVEPGPKRPYEEILPGDIYEPPAIKNTTRKPQVLKARRIKKNSKSKKVRSSQLSALKRSQLPPWRRYAVRFPRKKENKGKPKIVIVIDDMGVDRKRSKRIVALPGPLTLSYLTYAKSLYKQTRKARKAGHEIMLHVAMEPDNMDNDPGPRVLLRDLEPDEIEKRLVWGLSRLHRYVGINNHMGSKFTADRYGMTVVMKELHRRGLLFLDSRTTRKSVGAVIAHAVGVPYAERNIFLDNVNKLKAVKDRLAELERFARRRGKAIAIGHPRDATIEALSTWLTDVKSRGFLIVPITETVLVPKIAR